MNQADFRRMLLASSSGGGSSGGSGGSGGGGGSSGGGSGGGGSGTGGSGSGGGTRPARPPANNGHRFVPRGAGGGRGGASGPGRGGGTSGCGRDGAAHGAAAAVAAGYRDRAAERRLAETEVDDDAAAAARLDYHASKFLGGDLAHTHLVQGLDFALLAKVREERAAAGLERPPTATTAAAATTATVAPTPAASAPVPPKPPVAAGTAATAAILAEARRADARVGGTVDTLGRESLARLFVGVPEWEAMQRWGVGGGWQTQRFAPGRQVWEVTPRGIPAGGDGDGIGDAPLNHVIRSRDDVDPPPVSAADRGLHPDMLAYLSHVFGAPPGDGAASRPKPPLPRASKAHGSMQQLAPPPPPPPPPHPTGAATAADDSDDDIFVGVGEYRDGIAPLVSLAAAPAAAAPAAAAAAVDVPVAPPSFEGGDDVTGPYPGDDGGVTGPYPDGGDDGVTGPYPGGGGEEEDVTGPYPGATSSPPRQTQPPLPPPPPQPVSAAAMRQRLLAAAEAAGPAIVAVAPASSGRRDDSSALFARGWAGGSRPAAGAAAAVPAPTLIRGGIDGEGDDYGGYYPSGAVASRAAGRSSGTEGSGRGSGSGGAARDANVRGSAYDPALGDDEVDDAAALAASRAGAWDRGSGPSSRSGAAGAAATAAAGQKRGRPTATEPPPARTGHAPAGASMYDALGGDTGPRGGGHAAAGSGGVGVGDGDERGGAPPRSVDEYVRRTSGGRWLAALAAGSDEEGGGHQERQRKRAKEAADFAAVEARMAARRAGKGGSVEGWGAAPGPS